MQPGKNIKIFINYFLGPLLFLWLLFSIYTQIRNQPQLALSWQHIKNSFYSSNIFYLLFTILLMCINWGLEAWKWKVAMIPIYPVSFRLALKAILSGVSFSVSTPNRIGEYLGRMLFLPEGYRLKTIAVTLLSSISQLLITLICGTIGLIWLKKHFIEAGILHEIGYRFLLSGLLILQLIILLLYFKIAGLEKWIEHWMRNSKHLYLIQALQQFRHYFLIRLLALSLLRYLVFIIQYLLLFSLFNVHVNIVLAAAVVSVVFLAMAIIPSIALLEVGLRGEINIRLMSLFSANTLGIGLTAITIWVINLLLPAIAGSILILGVKVFKKRNGD